jgi:RimJ/RimL family protein N-acetyltransferase
MPTTVATDITLRPATTGDVRSLWMWRNDPGTRANCHTTDVVPLETHERWLAGVLANPDRLLLVAEEGGVPVGTVRWDRLDGETWELSWTVAPEHRGRGVGTRMVCRAVTERPANVASIHVAIAAGFFPDGERDDGLHFRLGYTR